MNAHTALSIFRVQVVTAAINVCWLWLCIFVVGLRLDHVFHFSWSACFSVVFLLDFFVALVLMKFWYDVYSMKSPRMRERYFVHLSVVTVVLVLAVVQQCLVVTKITPPATPLPPHVDAAPTPTPTPIPTPTPTPMPAEPPTPEASGALPWTLVFAPSYAIVALIVAYVSHLCPIHMLASDDDAKIERVVCGTWMVNAMTVCITFLEGRDADSSVAQQRQKHQQMPAFPLSRVSGNDDDDDDDFEHPGGRPMLRDCLRDCGGCIHYLFFGTIMAVSVVCVLLVSLRMDEYITWSWYVFFLPVGALDLVVLALIVRYMSHLLGVTFSAVRQRYILICVGVFVLWFVVVMQQYIFISNLQVKTQHWTSAFMPAYLIVGIGAVVYVAILREKLINARQSAIEDDVEDDDDASALADASSS